MKKTAKIIFAVIFISAFGFSLASAEEKSDPETIMRQAEKIFDEMNSQNEEAARNDFSWKNNDYAGKVSGSAFYAREIILENQMVDEMAPEEKIKSTEESLAGRILGNFKNILSI